MKISRTVSFGMGAVMALVIGSGTAYAATGGKFILGKANAAGATSTLKNANGTALSLNSKAGTPSLRVNSATKVPNLNSDRIDNYDSSAFALAAGQTNTVEGVSFPLDVDGDGVDDFLTAIATCPAGSKLTGGGGDDYTADGALFINSPLDRTSWMITSTSSDLSDPTDIVAYGVCYNPRGAIAGGSFRSEPTKVSAETLELAKERLAAKQR